MNGDVSHKLEKGAEIICEMSMKSLRKPTVSMMGWRNHMRVKSGSITLNDKGNPIFVEVRVHASRFQNG